MPVRRFVFALLAMAVIVAPACGQGFGMRGIFSKPEPAAGGSGVRWSGTVASAVAEAKQSQKLVLLHFWSPSCGPCKALESRVFNQPSVAGAIHSQFVPVKIDASASPELAQRYKVRAVPTDVVLDSDGVVLAQISSPPTAMAYVSGLMGVHGRWAGQAGRAMEQAVAAAPIAPALRAASHIATQPPAGGPAGPGPAAPPLYGVSAPSNEPPASPPANSAYANLNIPSAPVAPPVAPQQAAAKTPPQPSNPSPSSTVNPYATAAATAPPQPPAHPPVGLDGFCPVTMKRARNWVPGDPKYGAVHEGRTYLFAGPSERDEFLKNYTAYAPLLSGLDPVVWIETGKQVQGKREYGMEFGQSVFLFSSEESRKKFAANASGYAGAVQQRVAAAARQTTTR